MDKILVTGSSGFIGHHLVRYLKSLGYWVRGVDVRMPEFSSVESDDFILGDLRNPTIAHQACSGVQDVYHLAAEMGGMGFIADEEMQRYILVSNTQIDLNTITAAHVQGANRFFFSSSCCIYPTYRQTELDAPMLTEQDAYPAMPQKTYGHAKLYTELLCITHRDVLKTRIARFENVCGEEGTWQGGREKAPAALSRKIAIAKLMGMNEISVWGDGEAQRTFIHVDDMVRGIYRLMQSEYQDPVNLGSDDMISVNQLAYMLADIAGVQNLVIRHTPGPEGVRSRNASTQLARDVLAWQPNISLGNALERVYRWVEREVVRTDYWKTHTE